MRGIPTRISTFVPVRLFQLCSVLILVACSTAAPLHAQTVPADVSPAPVIDAAPMPAGEVLELAEAWMDQGVALADDAPRESKAAFAQAATHYQALVHQHGARNLSVLRALGVSRLHAGDTAGAIAALRAALELAPTDQRTRDTLRTARVRVEAAPADSAQTTLQRWLGLWRGWIPRSVLLMVGLALLAAGWGLGAIRVLQHGPSRVWIMTAFIAGGFPLGLLAHDWWRHTHTEHVVLAREATARGGPSAAVYEPVFEDPLPAGLEAIVTERRNDWAAIRLVSGDLVWVRGVDLLVINLLLGRETRPNYLANVQD